MVGATDRLAIEWGMGHEEGWCCGASDLERGGAWQHGHWRGVVVVVN